MCYPACMRAQVVSRAPITEPSHVADGANQAGFDGCVALSDRGNVPVVLYTPFRAMSTSAMAALTPSGHSGMYSADHLGAALAGAQLTPHLLSHPDDVRILRG
jgi:hypothetical protein